MGTTPSDSERMMAEIEAFLRTGEAPPAAPEPDLPPPPPPTRIHELRRPGKGLMTGGRAPWTRLRRRSVRRRARPDDLYVRGQRVGPAQRWRALLRRRRQTGPGRWGGDGWSTSGWPPGGGYPHDPPRWTPLRIGLVVAVILALLIVPGLFPSGAGGTSGTARPPSASGYAFLAENPGGTPVRWNPCQPIRYQTELTGAPSWFASDVSLAMAQIGAQTGIRFVDVGSAVGYPPAGFPGTAGRPSPVVIDWATAAQARQLKLTGSSSGVDGLARTALYSSRDPRTGRQVYVTGSVVVGPAAAQLPHEFTPGGLGILLYHELGRLVGLGEVAAPTEIMNRQVLSTPVTAFGPGDSVGLERLGAASGCVSAPANGRLQEVT